jgi:hypothetical protein
MSLHFIDFISWGVLDNRPLLHYTVLHFEQVILTVTIEQ